MPSEKSKLINISDLKDVQYWMRRFNISKEELLTAVDKFGPSVEAVSIGLRKGNGIPHYIN
jgi:hypothetical protein